MTLGELKKHLEEVSLQNDIETELYFLDGSRLEKFHLEFNVVHKDDKNKISQAGTRCLVTFYNN